MPGGDSGDEAPAFGPHPQRGIVRGDRADHRRRAYAASKAGVHYFTRVLAGELGPYDITVNCYAPGMIPTELNHFTEQPKERQERLLDTLTFRRWGEPRDPANLIVFLPRISPATSRAR